MASEGRGISSGDDRRKQRLREGSGVHLASRADVGVWVVLEVVLEVSQRGVRLGLLGAHSAQGDDGVDRVPEIGGDREARELREVVVVVTRGKGARDERRSGLAIGGGDQWHESGLGGR